MDKSTFSGVVRGDSRLAGSFDWSTSRPPQRPVFSVLFGFRRRIRGPSQGFDKSLAKNIFVAVVVKVFTKR
jgi:hypothetical protein